MRSFNSALARTALAAALVAGPALAAQAEVVLHRGNGGEPGTLDPHHSSINIEDYIVSDMFIGLLTGAADGSAIPGAAESWTISDDGLTYTFDLRDGATWSDGEPVTADDFVFSFNRVLAAETAAKYASILYPIKGAQAVNAGEDGATLGVRKIDDDTLEITLENPTPFFLDLLTHYTSYPVPQHVVEAHGDDWVKPGNMVSNGPYVLAEWVPQDKVRLVKNERFYDADNVQIDTVYFYPAEDRAAALRRFRAGEFDVNYEFPTEQLDFIKENLPNSYRIAPQTGLYYYPINNTDPTFQDRRIRAALNLAIDRRAITDQVLGTGEIPATSWVPPLPNYQPASAPWADMTMEEQIAEARRLMNDAGYDEDNRLRFVLRYNTNDDHRRVAVAIASMWQGIFVDVELFNTDVATHYNELQEQDFQVARAGWLADYPDAENFLYLLKEGVEFNYGRWSNPEFEALLQESYTILDPEARESVMRQAEQVALDDYASIPIYYYVSTNLVAPYVEGWVDNANDWHRTRWLSINEEMRQAAR